MKVRVILAIINVFGRVGIFKLPNVFLFVVTEIWECKTGFLRILGSLSVQDMSDVCKKVSKLFAQEDTKQQI